MCLLNALKFAHLVFLDKVWRIVSSSEEFSKIRSEKFSKYSFQRVRERERERDRNLEIFCLQVHNNRD